MRALCAACVMVAGAAASVAAHAASEPYYMIRALNHVQDRLVQGDVKAHPLQIRLLSHIGKKFAQTPAALWRKPANGYALVAFVLSGGSPMVIHRLMRSGVAPAVNLDLLTGALAYAQGRRRAAAALLGKLDAARLPRRLGGQLAIIQAALLRGENNRKAARLLDLARLMVPGSLIEEAALRRAISLAALTGDLERFDRLSRNYQRRFGSSVYAGKFQADFAVQTVALDFADKVRRLAKLETLMAGFDPAVQLRVCLAMAEAAVVAGQRNLSLFAARRVLALAAKGSPAAVHGRLYLAAAQVVTGDTPKLAIEIKAIDPARLSGPAREIRQAALELSGQLRAWPELPLPNLTRVRLQSDRKGDPQGGHSIDGLVERAEASLKAAGNDALEVIR